MLKGKTGFHFYESSDIRWIFSCGRIDPFKSQINSFLTKF